MLLLILLFLASAVSAQDDGNPHGWDRKRRCDHTDYSPPCGPCEGVGGLAYGDKNDEITLTSCRVISNSSSVDPSTLVKPIWANRWTSDPYHEILIGTKTDPFCFNSFPNNSSIGELCYRKDSGRQIYDMEKARAIRLDVTVESTVGKIASTVIHQGENMWIINKFPWYAAGIHQCICTKPRQGGDVDQPVVYPVQYNWTQQMFYIGREELGIEYMSPNFTKVVDHWAFGPHHVWSDPHDGRTIRMWQPFNGLQVFPNGTNPGYVNDTLFEDLPPPMCKKGGATFRIKCDDNGMPVVKPKGKVGAVAASPEGVAVIKGDDDKDTRRAKTAVPRAHYKGKTFREMSTVLNGWLKKSKTVSRTRECSEWSAKEIQKLQAMLYLARNTDLDDIYQTVNDNRKMRAAVSDLDRTWDELNSYVHESQHHYKQAPPPNGTMIESEEGRRYMHDVLRDGHCHEAVMWYVHHLTEDAKKILASSNVEIPLLSYEKHAECPPARLVDRAQTAAHLNGDEGKYDAVCKAYAEKVTCQSCHSNVHP